MKKTNFGKSLYQNEITFRYYYNRLLEIAMSRFKWNGLPDTVDKRYLEFTILTKGHSVFFYEEDADCFMALPAALSGPFDVYNIPQTRKIIAVNGYHTTRTASDSVIIYDNYLHYTVVPTLRMFAERLYNLDRAIDVNANAQKTPILIMCDENQRLTMQNLYQKFDGNEPVIYGNKALNPKSVSVLKTDAPFVSDKLYKLKSDIWNEVMTFLGIANVNTQKRERLITSEVTANLGGTFASRFSPLQTRQEACEKINDMYGLDVWCTYNEDGYQPTALSEAGSGFEVGEATEGGAKEG